MSTSASLLSSILSAITHKDDWYSKVFNQEIVTKWRQEALATVSKWREHPVNEMDFSEETMLELFDDIFDNAISYLQCTAQGSVHSPDCDWDEGSRCDICDEVAYSKIDANRKEFDLEPEDVIDDDVIDECFDGLKMEKCSHGKCVCKRADCELNQYINYSSSFEADSDLLISIERLMKSQPIDWHPGSNEQVRDLVHPSMYCYVKGASQFEDGSVEAMGEEETRYQWLPAEFKLWDRVTIESRINNLDDESMIPQIADLFETFVPRLEDVLRLSYNRNGYTLPENVMKQSLTNKNLQVIVKIGSIHLNEEKPDYLGGSWHVEGMPHEHIVATCLSYLKVEGLTDSYLEFRKPTYINEESVSYPQGDSSFTEHHYGIKSHWDGQMNYYLGLIKCSEGASVVFPNTLQHRVMPFSLAPGCKEATRIIVAFFVIDPDHRIISTADIPDQRNIMTYEQARYHRERLMFHRKYYVNQLNEVLFEREFSLCEH